MSFGFGGSNVITLLERANKLRDRFADAPSQLRAISSECVAGFLYTSVSVNGQLIKLLKICG